MEMLRSEKTSITPERVSEVAFDFWTTMVDGMILSAVSLLSSWSGHFPPLSKPVSSQHVPK